MNQQAAENETIDTEVVDTEINEDVEVNEPEVIEGEETEVEPDVEEGEETETEELEEVFEFDGQTLESPTSTEEDDSESAPQWVKDLRAQHKESQRRIKELEAEKSERESQPVVQHEELPIPKMPTLESVDYDDEAHEKAVGDWLEQVNEIKTKNANFKQHQEAAQKQYQEKFETYQTKRSEIVKKFKDYEQVEQLVIQGLKPEKQAMIIAESTKPEMVSYALGKNPELLKRFNDAKSPIEVGRILGEIEQKANVVSRAKVKSNTTPTVRKAGTPSQRGLEAAIEKARKNGDYTTVMQLKKQLK